MADIWRVLLSLAACGVGYAATQRLAMRFAHARSGRHGPPLAGDLAAALAGVQVNCLFLAITARPVMAAALTLALIVFLLVVNTVKERVLHEPLVLADAWLLPQVRQYPEMYLPFMPMRAIIAGTMAFAACVGLLAYSEPGIPRAANWPLFCLLTAGATLPVLFLWLLRYNRLPESVGRFLLRHLPVSHDAAADAARNGALAATLMHPVLAGKMEKQKPDFLENADRRPQASRWPENFERFLDEIGNTPLDICPHVLLIQAESFCDIREYVDGEQKEALKDFLPNWDRLKAMGRTLPTPENAYGAYTMRTEFSMLTGLRAEDLGAHAFNPYLLAARQPIWSLARFFRDKGYATLCMHPYHKGFFRRDKVMPNLGFERFLGIEELGELERFGPYVSDLALGRRILQELAAATRPMFCFAITMECHGPWFPGRLPEEVTMQYLPEKNVKKLPPELQVYLCHLARMDSLFSLPGKERLARDSEIWVYGDHPPSGLAS